MTGYHKQQSGVALMISLVILLLLTLIMVTAVRVNNAGRKNGGQHEKSEYCIPGRRKRLTGSGSVYRYRQTQRLIGMETAHPTPIRSVRLNFQTGPSKIHRTRSVLQVCAAPLHPCNQVTSHLLFHARVMREPPPPDIATISAEPEYIIELIVYRTKHRFQQDLRHVSNYRAGMGRRQ